MKIASLTMFLKCPVNKYSKQKKNENFPHVLCSTMEQLSSQK